MKPVNGFLLWVLAVVLCDRVSITVKHQVEFPDKLVVARDDSDAEGFRVTVRHDYSAPEDRQPGEAAEGDDHQCHSPNHPKQDVSHDSSAGWYVRDVTDWLASRRT